MIDQFVMLRERIHTAERHILTTGLFLQQPCKICLLDFIGASSYFITEFGLIFSRQKLNTNKNGIVAQDWIPLVIRDIYLQIPWVCLVTTSGKIWWPVNQLLGWAFSPYIEHKKQYFLSEIPWVWGLHYTKYQWKDTVPVSEGQFYNFMELLYQEH